VRLWTLSALGLLAAMACERNAVCLHPAPLTADDVVEMQVHDVGTTYGIAARLEVEHRCEGDEDNVVCLPPLRSETCWVTYGRGEGSVEEALKHCEPLLEPRTDKIRGLEDLTP
jgi:hypothetical protein